MASFLVLYGTGEGQTATVANRIVDVLEERGHDATAVGAEEVPDDTTVADVDAVLVGASVRGGKHQPEVREFVEANRDALAAKPSAFFQLSLSSATEEGAEQAAGYVEQFVEETGWHPDRTGLFGGALRYSEYGFLKRLVIKQFAKQAVPGVDALAAAAAIVEGRLGIVPPGSGAPSP